MKTLLFLTGVLFASTSMCNKPSTKPKTGAGSAVTVAETGTKKASGLGPGAGAPRQEKEEPPVLPAHLFM